MSWQQALPLSELPTGSSGKALDISGQSVAFFNNGGKIYAILNHCPHRGGPLAEAYLERTQVTCPWHAWQFDVKTGECDTMKGAKQKTFKTKIEKDQIFVDIE